MTQRRQFIFVVLTTLAFSWKRKKPLGAWTASAKHPFCASSAGELHCIRGLPPFCDATVTN